jgi:hypothetical protein
MWIDNDELTQEFEVKSPESLQQYIIATQVGIQNIKKNGFHVECGMTAMRVEWLLSEFVYSHSGGIFADIFTWANNDMGKSPEIRRTMQAKESFGRYYKSHALQELDNIFSG